MILRIDNLSKAYGKNNSYQKVLDNINLEFKSGEFICILGESGSGKSSLLNLIGGLDTNYNGSINVNNRNLKYIDLDEYRGDKLGFIFQNFNLIPSLSVLDNILLPIEKIKSSYIDKKNKAYNLLRRLNIYSIKNKRIIELSGGQKQRVAIARALINEPDIILADEPTGALDEKNSLVILDILKEIQKEGKLVIVVTHSKRVIDYSTRVVTIKDGKIDSDKKIKRVKESKTEKIKMNQFNKLYLLKYGIRNILNNKKRNIFITLASSIGLIGIILSLFIGSGIKNYMHELIVDKANPLIYSVEKTNDEVPYFDSDEISDIENIKHVDEVIKNTTYQVSSIKIEDEEYSLNYLNSFNDIELEEGNDEGLIINKTLYDKLDLLNEEVTLTFIDNYKVIETNIEVTGIYKGSGLSLIDDSKEAYISYKNLESIYKEEDLDLNPNLVSIKINDNDNIELVKKELDKLDMTCINNIDLYNELEDYLTILTFILSMFSFISLIVSIIMISIITNITVLERTKEIGLLRSIGFSKKDIKHIFNTESILLGFFIGLFSINISKYFIKIINRILSNKFDITLDVSLGKYYLFGLLLSMFLLYISTYFPSKKASNLDPIASLRYE
ncbi:MAG: ATP-binding cassette domain-containing protein [Bacilli bacterium]|nr:ATP-binding cassette domain-containing protein [Bacilli bacterium]